MTHDDLILSLIRTAAGNARTAAAELDRICTLAVNAQIPAEWVDRARYVPPLFGESVPAGEALALARSILSHRPWCTSCRPHAREAAEALEGATIEQILAGRGESGVSHRAFEPAFEPGCDNGTVRQGCDPSPDLTAHLSLGSVHRP